VADADAFLAKAEESLASAEDDFANERFNSCARGGYYAAFQAAVAALVFAGIRSRGRWEHDFVHSQFAGILVYRRKLYRVAFRSLLQQAFGIRANADYTEKQVHRQDVGRLLTLTRNLVQQMTERMNGNR